MSLPLPTSLSPSKVASFKDCALAFRLSVIDRIPEAPSPQAAKGTLVHRVLQRLFWEDPAWRTKGLAHRLVGVAADEVLGGDEYGSLHLEGADRAEFLADAAVLVDNYFRLEDPRDVRCIGTELRMAVAVGDLTLRGIIDRLELDADGQLVVTDYKTGSAPSVSHELPRLGGVHFYAFLCEKVLGRRPARIQLLHLREPLVISSVPSEGSARGLQVQTRAIWSAIERACREEDFRPRPGRLCSWCSFHAYCPAVGGDLAQVPFTATAGGEPTGTPLSPPAGATPPPAPLTAAGAGV
jgi:putative RecB family exonuclease